MSIHVRSSIYSLSCQYLCSKMIMPHTVYSNTFQTFTMEAKCMSADQTAPKGFKNKKKHFSTFSAIYFKQFFSIRAKQQAQ